MDSIISSQNQLYFPDDFDRINNKYFKRLRETGDIVADLSFWYDTMSPVTKIISLPKINKYRSDFQKGLANEKETFINCINQWDSQIYKYDQITICSSVTTASFITLLFLQTQNVRTVFFETPAYFASIEQARSLNLDTILLPTYLHNDFQVSDDVINFIKTYNEPKAIWITQPRFGLGINQNRDTISKLVDSLNKYDFLIIDEATEQLFPTFINDVNFTMSKNIIKVRSFFKSTGLNGPRISFILHHEKYRYKIENLLEVAQGAVDCFSLEFGKKNLENVEFFKLLLKTSNEYVKSVRKKVQLYALGTDTFVIPLDNGYIGSIAVKLKQNKDYFKDREELIGHCASHKVAVILGATMKFAKDPLYEYIRINYFNTEYTLLKGMELLLKFND